MNAPLIIAGSIAMLGVAIHGVAGELLVVRKLSLDVLPSSTFGGPRMTKAMIHVSWHITTIAFLIAGSALLLSGAVLDGDDARALGLLGAGACTGFTVLVLGLGAGYMRSPRIALQHPAPVLLTATTVLAWWGAL
jgi:hypothetical protein